MTTPLRPLSTGELLDRSFSLYRNNFLLFAGIATVAATAAVAAPLLLLLLGVPVPLPGVRLDPRTAFPSLMTFVGVFMLLTLIGNALASAATIYAVSKVHLEQKVTIGESYSKIFPLVGRILGITILIFLFMVGVGILVALALGLISVGLVAAFRSSALLTLLTVALALVGYAFIFRIYFKYVLAVPACVLEDTGASESLSRSGFLTKGSLWRIFLIYLLMTLIGIALSFCLQLPGNLLALKAPQLALIWYFPATFLASSLAFPISTIAISLVYYDQRVRKEAFDLQFLMQAIAQPGESATAAPIG